MQDMLVELTFLQMDSSFVQEMLQQFASQSGMSEADLAVDANAIRSLSVEERCKWALGADTDCAAAQ